MNKPRILITGGAGFIGSHIADLCVAEGWETHILDNMSLGKKENVPPEARLFETDIREKEVEKLFKQYQYDFLCHHAAQVNLRESVRDPLNDVDINIVGTIRLLEYAVKYNVKYVILASSGGAVYGEQEVLPAAEGHPTNPDSPYGISKLTCEKYCGYFYKTAGLKYAALRYTNVYGPRQNPDGEAGVVAIFISTLLGDQQPAIHGDGKQTRDYVYVEDVARANLLALQKQPVGPINICTSLETDVNRIYSSVACAVGMKSQPRYGPPKVGEQLRSVCSYGKAQRLLGWTPAIQLEDGIRKTCQYFKNNT